MSPFSATRPLGDFDFRCGEPLLPLLLELDPDDEDDDEPEGDPDLDLEPDEPDEREASSLDFAMAVADEFLSNPAALWSDQQAQVKLLKLALRGCKCNDFP